MLKFCGSESTSGQLHTPLLYHYDNDDIYVYGLPPYQMFSAVQNQLIRHDSQHGCEDYYR